MPTSDTPQPHYPTVEYVLDAIAGWINRYRAATGRQDAFGTCDAAEVSRIADELGVGPAELRALAAKGPHGADLLQKMLTALKVDAADLSRREPAVMRDLQRLCVACDHKRQCQHEIEQGTAAAHYHAFCPNAFTLDAVFEEQARATQH